MPGKTKKKQEKLREPRKNKDNQEKTRKTKIVVGLRSVGHCVNQEKPRTILLSLALESLCFSNKQCWLIYPIFPTTDLNESQGGLIVNALQVWTIMI